MRGRCRGTGLGVGMFDGGKFDCESRGNRLLRMLVLDEHTVKVVLIRSEALIESCCVV